MGQDFKIVKFLYFWVILLIALVLHSQYLEFFSIRAAGISLVASNMYVFIRVHIMCDIFVSSQQETMMSYMHQNDHVHRQLQLLQ
jgi:hypothetical protein